MNRSPILSGSLAPASVASRIRLWLKQSQDATNLRWPLRVLSGGFDNKSGGDPPFFFSDHDTKAMLCVDLAKNLPPRSWLEIPGAAVIDKESGAKKKKMERPKLAEFSQVIPLSEKTRANLCWSRVIPTALSAVPLTVTLLAETWFVEAPAVLGVASACLFEARTAVLFVHPSKKWAILEMPSVAYWLVDELLEFAAESETANAEAQPLRII